jgi:hypothetical protein
VKTLCIADYTSRQHKAAVSRRAIVAAHLQLGIGLPSQSIRDAAGMVGVGSRLAKAASDVVASGDEVLLARVLSGQQSLIAAATEIREHAGTCAIVALAG